jgi:hypothetical protein
MRALLSLILGIVTTLVTCSDDLVYISDEERLELMEEVRDVCKSISLTPDIAPLSERPR